MLVPCVAARKQVITPRSHRRRPLHPGHSQSGYTSGFRTREVHRAITPAPRIGLDMIAIPAGSDGPRSTSGSGLGRRPVRGCVSGETEGQCVRCLEPIAGTASVYLTELYAYPDSVTDETTDADEIHRIVDDPSTSSRPSSTRWRSTYQCAAVPAGVPGPVPEVRYPSGRPDPGHHHDEIDPRWAGLAAQFASTEDPESTEVTQSVDRGAAHRALRSRRSACRTGYRRCPTRTSDRLDHRRSYAYEHGRLPTNERLEFLGDFGAGGGDHRAAVPHPSRPPEGELAKIRASVVNMHALAAMSPGDWVPEGSEPTCVSAAAKR